MQSVVEVAMVRSDLNDIPHYALNGDYFFKFYENGDAQIWVNAQSAAEPYHKSLKVDFLAKEFGNDFESLEARQIFIKNIKSGDIVATATAWNGELIEGIPMGRIHWVAVVPSHQGRGLAKALCTKMLYILRKMALNKHFLPLKISG